MNTPNLDMLFNPKSVAVIGASASPGKIGTITLLCTIAGGFKGKIYPINPNKDEILGLKTYGSVKDVPDKIDLAMICLPANKVLLAIRECNEVGVKFGVVISAGFGELGEEGRKKQKEMVEEARKGEMRLVGPNCMGIGSADPKLYATMNFTIPKAGDVSMVSQSATMVTLTTLMASGQGIGFNKYVSSGNEADIRMEDFIEYYANDLKTKVIVAYIEGVREGRRFIDASRRATENKPFIVLKGGITGIGAAAASSHTGALSGEDMIFDAVCAQTGITRVSNHMKMIDLIKAFLLLPLPKGRKVGIVSGQGGLGVLTADSCVKHGLEVPKLTKESISELNTFLPYFWSHRNPIDVTAGFMTDLSALTKSLEVLLRQEDIHSVICLPQIWSPMFDVVSAQVSDEMQDIFKSIAVEMMGGVEETLINDFIKLKNEYGKPMIAIGIFIQSGSKSNRILEENGIPVYETPDQAAHVLSKLIEYAEYLRERSIRPKS
jgi:acetyltransferase